VGSNPSARRVLRVGRHAVQDADGTAVADIFRTILGVVKEVQIDGRRYATKRTMDWSGDHRWHGNWQVASVADASSRTVLRVKGHHYHGQDGALVQREATGETLRFPVFAYPNSGLTMQALGSYDHELMRFREIGHRGMTWLGTTERQECEVVIVPETDVTDEIILISIVASSFLSDFSRTPSA
jgi:hypothetical protein